MRVGLILGGGGEVGVAWEIGVLAALQHDAGFDASTSTVIAGTSAGAVVGAFVAQRRPLVELVKLERSGQGARIGAAPGAAPREIPRDIIAALVSTEGTLEQRNAGLGKLALEAPVEVDQATFVDGFQEIVGTSDWPSADFRPTTVNAESGQTTLWDSGSGIRFAAAVASSCAVPGVFPPVEHGGRHYIDVPRRPFSGELVRSKSLDAIIFVGLILPILANNNEQKDELAQQAAAGRLAIVTVTGGPGIALIGADLMDHSARPRAVEVGLEDGRHVADAVKALSSAGRARG